MEKILQKCYNFVGKVGRKEVNMEDIFMDTAKVMAKGQVTIPKKDKGTFKFRKWRLCYFCS